MREVNFEDDFCHSDVLTLITGSKSIDPTSNYCRTLPLEKAVCMKPEYGDNTYILIMAGGAGTRFWPASTEAFPKQFLDILGTGKSLLTQTFDRFISLVPSDKIYVVTNAKYADIVHTQLPQLPKGNILCEPSRNNTAPCIAYATYKIQSGDPNAQLVVVPSDHLILKETIFLNKIQNALRFSRNRNAICTLGIQPVRPDTGYGYIHFGDNVDDDIYQVLSFREKPDAITAAHYIQQKTYLWNAGIFIFSAETMIASLEQWSPEICRILSPLPYNTEQEQDVLNNVYPTTPNISIDYAVMERAENVFTLPADIGWTDLGTWASLYAELQKDEAGNAIQTDRSVVRDSKGNLIRLPSGKKAVIRGLTNMIIVDEPEGLLIYPMHLEQDIKQDSAEVIKTK